MKRGISILFALGLFLFSANIAFASVRINEIAWMGTAVSGTDEWIELHNDGSSAVDLSGWKIDADDGSPSITLSGNISGGGYYLIERTDDDTVPGITADLVAPFGNGLGNAGETLRLKDTSGASIDTVVGGTDWVNIGGDNATKETPQRTANSWVTGVPTPRAENVAQGGEVLGAATTNTTSQNESASTTTTVINPVSKSAYPSGIYPRKNISVQAGDDKRGFTGFAINFTGSSSGLYDESLDRATYRWNFGDGAATEGRVVTHAYEIAGEYIVTLEVFWADHRASDRLSVTITDPDVVVSASTLGEKGHVTLTNRTDREVDLSGWSLVRSDGVRFVFPPNSFILPKKNFLLSNKIGGFTSGEGTFTLRSSEDVVIFSSSAPIAESTRVNTAGIVAGATVVRNTTPASPLPRGNTSAQTLPSNAVATSGATETASAVLWEKTPADIAGGVGAVSFDLRGGMKWSFALLALVLIVLAGFLIARSNAAEVSAADEYAIIEDIIESREDLDGTR